MSANDSNVHRLFSNGERGVWYDPKDISTMYQDSSGTTPVTGDAQPVGLILDKSKDIRINDRSVNDRGLKVVGTLQRTPVATGADLMAYSGFSTDSYLEQSYNPDLDFGTGDFCIMGWVNTESSNSYQYFCGRGVISDGFAGESFWLRVNPNNTFTIKLGASEYTSTKTMPLGSFFYFSTVRKDGILTTYINNEVYISVASTRDLTHQYAVFKPAHRTGQAVNFLRGSLALLRISATAPTAEQIAKIYSDERALFQENAKATLYGTSDAVTALAHDDVTDLLHVGTSSGRSDFKGLRRVNNTTDAVGTAISASDGLIVEE